MALSKRSDVIRQLFIQFPFNYLCTLDDHPTITFLRSFVAQSHQVISRYVDG